MSEVTVPVEPPGFSLFLPEGFITLPAGEIDNGKFRSLAAGGSAGFGLVPAAEIAQGRAQTTVPLCPPVAAARAGGSSYTAAGFFRSPDDVNRPIMALVNCF